MQEREYRSNKDQTKIKQRTNKDQAKIKQSCTNGVCGCKREQRSDKSLVRLSCHPFLWATSDCFTEPPTFIPTHPSGLHINQGGVIFTAPWFGFNNILGEISSGFESVPGPISLELLSPDCQLHRRMDVPTPVKIDRLFSKHPNPDQFSVVQRGIPSSVWSQPVNQGLIGSFQPLVRPWLSPRRVGWEARKRSKTSVFFSLALLIIDYRLGSRIHFASQQ